MTMSVHMGPGNSTAYNPRCLTRDFAPLFATSKLNETNVKRTLRAKSFAEFDILCQGGITPPVFTYHGGGHIGVGGELGVVCVRPYCASYLFLLIIPPAHCFVLTQTFFCSAPEKPLPHHHGT